ncbi:MAG: endonuclease/exonuclease/phosphatase family protein [Candidatus Nanoarchaeia archaeon]|nr:endonuclease/exonuclease/phosphatase family protein [Candidatus Nanoarchaeia archaeon]
MKLKVITNNIWRYYEWETRKDKLIAFLKEKNADLIFLQEAAYDERKKWKNQVHEINEALNYKDFAFGKLADMTKWHKEPINWVMHIGLGILSKYPLKYSEVVLLPIYPQFGDKKQLGFYHVVINTPEGDMDLINVHFSNNNESAKLHLKETLNWCKERNIKPIIAGDFNIKIVGHLLEESQEEYEISYAIKSYKSFYPTEFSHDKEPITLDYILAHKNKFRMTDVECIDTDISDHKPVMAIITII